MCLLRDTIDRHGIAEGHFGAAQFFYVEFSFELADFNVKHLIIVDQVPGTSVDHLPGSTVEGLGNVVIKKLNIEQIDGLGFDIELVLRNRFSRASVTSISRQGLLISTLSLSVLCGSVFVSLSQDTANTMIRAARIYKFGSFMVESVN